MTQTQTKPTIAGLPIERAGDRPLKVNQLIFGDPGAGKTRLAASAEEVEEMRPVLFIDMEGGMATFQKLYPDMHVVRIKDKIGPDGKVNEYAWERFSRLYEEIKTGKHKYGTFILDSITEAYDMGQKWWLAQVRKEKPDRDPDMPAERDWVKQSAQFRRMIKLFRDLDANVIFTALKGTVTRKIGDTIQVVNYVPQVPGKLQYAVPAEPDIVSYLWVDNPSKKQQTEGGDESKGIRKMLSQPLNKYICKDRFDVLPTVMNNPTMRQIYELVRGGE